MKLSAFKIDPEAVEIGDWVKDIPECDDLEINTKGINNAAFNAMQQAKIRSLPRALRRPAIDPTALARITQECVVETCTLGWKNLQDADGSEIPYSREKHRELQKDPRYRPFMDACVYAASFVGDQRAEDVEGVVKN